MTRILREYDALWLTLAAWAIVILFNKAYYSALRADFWLPPIVFFVTLALFIAAVTRSVRWWRTNLVPVSVVIIPASLFGALFAFIVLMAWYMCCP